MKKSHKKRARKPRMSEADYVSPTKERSAAIGRLISEWSRFEIESCYITGKAFGLYKNKHARIIFGSEDWLGKLEKLRLLCAANRKPKVLLSLNAIAKEADACRKIRNLLAHGVWMKKSKTKQKQLLIANFRGSKDGYDFRVYPRHFHYPTNKINEASEKIPKLISRLGEWQDNYRDDLMPPPSP